MGIQGILGKIVLTGRIQLKTGLHIGGSSDFSAIGAVDNTIVRDPLTKQPYIPGSSLKGKMRYLIARIYAANGQLPQVSDENQVLKRLFGSSGNNITPSRLQFFDSFMTEESVERIRKMDTDLYLTEIKFENTIDRLTAVANPRQIERVPAGAEFGFKLTYNIEDQEELEEDMKHVGYGVGLLENDYIGGHGSRGYGRVEFPQDKFSWEYIDYSAITGITVNEPLLERASQAFNSAREGAHK